MKLIHLIYIVAAVMMVACGNNNDSSQQADSSTVTIENHVDSQSDKPVTIPETETYYGFDSTKAIVIADPITYDVTVKNYIPNDDWEEERLANTNVKAIVNALFQAVYKGRLTPYDYISEQPITIEQVKEMEKKYNRDDIGKIMFTEHWYFSETTLQFTKKVTRMTFGYGKRLDGLSDMSFYPSFMVKLDE